MKFRPNLRACVAPLAVIALALAPNLPAASLYWDGGDANIETNGDGLSDGGAGTWDASLLNWDQGADLPHTAWSNTSNNTAVFGGTGGIITAEAVAVGGIVFESGGYTINTGTVTFGTSGTIDIGAGNSAIFGTIISGAAEASITKTGLGQITFNNPACDYAGQLTVAEGTLRVTAGGANINANSRLGNSALPVILGSDGKTATLFIDSTSAQTGNKPFVLATGGTGRFQLGTGNQTLSGEISGDGNLAKAGSGILILTGANTFTGTTTISSGPVQLGHLDALKDTSGIIMAGGATLRTVLGDLVLTAPVVLDGGTATLNAPAIGTSGGTVYILTLNGSISGTGNVNMVGIQGGNVYGNILLGAASTYEGNTLLTTDTNNSNKNIFVRLGVDNALPVTTVLTLDGQNGTGTSPGRGAVLELNGHNQTLAGLTNVPRTLRYQRVMNTSAIPAILTVNNTASFTFSGQLGTGAGVNFGLVKDGPGVFTLSASNAYAGSTKVLAGILSLAHSQAMQSSPLDTAGSVTGDDDSGLATSLTSLTLGGLTGDKNLSALFTTLLGGYDAVTALTLNLGGNAVHSYAGAISNGAGDMSLTKSGAGTQILGGANTYTGATTVAAGTLIITGTTSASSAVTVTGGILGGDGGIGGSVTVGADGNLAPGTSAGTLEIGGSLDLAAMAGGAGKMTFDLDGLAEPNDRISVSGTVEIGMGLLGFSDFVFRNLGGMAAGTYKLVTSGGITGTLDEADLSGRIGVLTGTLQITGNDLELTVVPGSAYDTWSGGAPADGDANHDGVENGVAWALGAASPNENAIGRLPTIDNTSDPDFVLFRFNRSDAANDDPKTTITVEYATNLAAWTPVGADTDDVKTEVTPGSPTDTVVVKLRRSTLAPDGKLFARLKVMVTE